MFGIGLVFVFCLGYVLLLCFVLYLFCFVCCIGFVFCLCFVLF